MAAAAVEAAVAVAAEAAAAALGLLQKATANPTRGHRHLMAVLVAAPTGHLALAAAVRRSILVAARGAAAVVAAAIAAAVVVAAASDGKHTHTMNILIVPLHFCASGIQFSTHDVKNA